MAMGGAVILHWRMLPVIDCHAQGNLAAIAVIFGQNVNFAHG
jgi:hypothetical protein